MSGQWYLGFDCATKTFAFSLSQINLSLDQIRNLRERLTAATVLNQKISEWLVDEKNMAAAIDTLTKLAPIIADLELKSRNLIRIVDGETTDLCPGIPDKNINTVSRIRAVVNHIRNRIGPSLTKHIPAGAPKLKVLVEFQMGQNPSARSVASAIVAMFVDDDVTIIGPSLKNSIWLSPAGHYGLFAEKYKTSYSANKAHAKYNFELAEKLFGTNIPITKPAALRGHIADSFMQVLGYLAKGYPQDIE